MKKVKIQIEYVFDSVSRKSLWNQITMQSGLSHWFADRVEIKNDVYTFYWNNEASEAEVLVSKEERRIHFRWVEEEDCNAFFEFRIHTIELTGATVFEITDYCYPDEKGDTIDLWDTQVEALKRSLGI